MIPFNRAINLQILPHKTPPVPALSESGGSIDTMSINAAIQCSLINHQDGGADDEPPQITVVKHRYLRFLAWQCLLTTIILLISKTLLLSPFTTSRFKPTFFSIMFAVTFYLCLTPFIDTLFLVVTPHPLPFASTFEISGTKIHQIIVSGGDQSLWAKRLRISFSFVVFVGGCAVTTGISLACLCCVCEVYDDNEGWWRQGLAWSNLAFRGAVVGLFYAMHYLYNRRWLLQFPIIQRPPFFRFKMGIPLSIRRALGFSAVGFLLSGLLSLVLPTKYRCQGSDGHFIVEQIVFYIGSFVCILRWELTLHLHQVLHTERFEFAPPKGSVAAKKIPSLPLLTTLEESTPKSLWQYLAYLDLCMVCENNVDTWRRAAFFEESGQTYQRIIAAGLKPLEQFVQNLAEGLESSASENLFLFSDQLSSPTEQLAVQKLYESFYDAQLCTWSARITSSLTARSRKEDRFGVARGSGSYAAVMSTLLSSLLAVETLMEKMTSTQSAHLMGRARINWATINTGKRESLLYAKANSLADILKASICNVVSAFHDPMLSSDKLGDLQKDWIISGKPRYGTHELLLHKLRVFLDFQAS